MSEQVKQLQDQNNALKIRVFDAEEALKQEQAFKNQVFTALFQALDMPEDKANDPQAYVDRANELRAQAESKCSDCAEVEAEVVESPRD